jgi:predicted dehydrogenase
VEHRVVVIGDRAAFERLGRTFQATSRAVVGWVANDDAAPARMGDVHVFRRLADARDFFPTAAVVATATDTHLAVAQHTVSLGCHVLVEPPLDLNLEGVQELRRLVRERAVVAAVGYPDRHYAAFQVLREALTEHRFGRPIQLIALRGVATPPAGSVVQHVLTHLLNLGEWLLGPIDQLTADAGRLAEEDSTAEDTAHVLARHGKVFAVYAAHQPQRPSEMVVTVNCTQGTMRAELPENRLRWMTDATGQWSEEVFTQLDEAAVQLEQAHQFLNAIEGRAARLCTLDQAVQTLRVNRAVLASAERRVWVRNESKS